MLENLYIFIENEKVDNAFKYGMKLSEYANKIILKKRGISAYLSPKDSSKYLLENYTCLRISAKDLNIFVYNKICENTNSISGFFCNYTDYLIGSYESPRAIICSSILPENINIYNKILDIPVIIENSESYYYEKFVSAMLENTNFSYYELYQMLLVFGEKKNSFKVETINENLKIYTDLKTNKKYTRKTTTNKKA
ncbi:MAG: hypothetical protein RSA08_03885 [Clostridia bacterium]